MATKTTKKKTTSSSKTTKKKATKAKGTKKAKKKKKRASRNAGDNWIALMAQVEDKSKKYSIREKFEINDLVDHPKFGPGVVTEYNDEEKIVVIFQDGPRLLVHNKG